MEYPRVDGNKWIYFEKCDDTPKTEKWAVINKSTEEPLAQIEWYYAWRQYVIYPEPNTLYNDGCLEAIIVFMKRLNIEKKLYPDIKVKQY